MRHLRDPITGLCTVCGKSGLHDHSGVSTTYHDDDIGSGYIDRKSNSRSGSPTSRSGQRLSRKVIYVNSSPTMTDYIDRPGSASSITSSRMTSHSRSPSPTGSERNYRTTTVTSTTRGASPAQTTSSSRRTTYRHDYRQRYGRNYDDGDDGCCARMCPSRGRSRRMTSSYRNSRRTTTYRNNRKSFDPEYGDDYGEDRCCGYQNNETATYGAGTWGQRHCCALGVTLGVLLALAGIAVALYFGITAALAETKRKQAVSSYVLSNKVNYVVYGADQLCNPYNNGTAVSVMPNCDATTTRIAIAPGGLAIPTDPAWASVSAATSTVVRAVVHGGRPWPAVVGSLVQVPVMLALLELIAFYVCSGVTLGGGELLFGPA